MISFIYLGKIGDSSIEYLNRLNEKFPVGIITDRNYKELKVDFHRNINSYDVVKVLEEIGLDFAVIASRPYKLCDWKPFWYMVYEKLGADLTLGFGYSDLDLYISDSLLRKIRQAENVVFLSGTGGRDYGHLRYYRFPVRVLYELFPITIEPRGILNDKYSYAFDESHIIRSINAHMKFEVMTGFDQSIYHNSLHNTLNTKAYRSIEMIDNDVYLEDERHDYFHCQKRAFSAGDNIQGILGHFMLERILKVATIILSRLKAKIYVERRYGRRFK